MSMRAVFWDSDNTLIDNAPLHFEKHRATLAGHGIHLDESWMARIYHNNGTQNWQWLHDELGLRLPCTAYLEQIDAWYTDHIGQAPLRPGIEAALDLCDEHGLPMAVVSNARRRSLMAGLTAKGLPPRFRFILAKEDYEGRKPEPAPYLAALSRMREEVLPDLEPGQCLVIEDDPLGVEAAAAAGMPVIHRRLAKAQEPSDKTPYTAYDEEAFLQMFRTLVSGE